MDYGCVVIYEDILDGEGRNLGDQYTAEGICYAGVETYEGKGGFFWFGVVDLDTEILLCGNFGENLPFNMSQNLPYLFKIVYIPSKARLSWEKFWVLVIGGICDLLETKANNLQSLR